MFSYENCDYCTKFWSISVYNGVFTLEYKNCFLYGLLSKQKLKELLHIKRDVYCRSSFINSKINVYIDRKGRIIEAPDADIKAIQRHIRTSLLSIGVPNYVYSGIKGKDYRRIEEIHKDFDYTYCLDIKKFYYNTSRNNIYNFFITKLKNSNDVANILTNLSSIDLELKNFCGCQEIINRINNHSILSNHLIAGSPLSTLLSFYANVEMFEEINDIASNGNILFSLYVDDLIFSSHEQIQDNFKNKIIDILKKYKFTISTEKIRNFEKCDTKKIFS